MPPVLPRRRRRVIGSVPLESRREDQAHWPSLFQLNCSKWRWPWHLQAYRQITTLFDYVELNIIEIMHSSRLCKVAPTLIALASNNLLKNGSFILIIHACWRKPSLHNHNALRMANTSFDGLKRFFDNAGGCNTAKACSFILRSASR